MIQPIRDEDLEEACRFAHQHLGPQIPVEGWIRAFRYDWPAQKPNNGFLLRDDSARVVGVFFAIYSERVVRGTTVRNCNLTSWCVLPEHRTKSMSLALSILAQPGYQFINLSPNPRALQIFDRLGFRTVRRSLVVVANPAGVLESRAGILTEPDQIDRALDEPARTIFRHHLRAPSVGHLGLQSRESTVHLIFRRRTRKHLPVVDVLHVSDPDAFRRLWPRMAGHFLRRGAILTLIPDRYLAPPPRATIRMADPQLVQFKGPQLEEADLDDLYSERVTLGGSFATN